jgi:hypothetical protein
LPVVSTSPHKRTKGCPVCKPSKHKDLGQAARMPLSALRRTGGRLHRVDRHDQWGRPEEK